MNNPVLLTTPSLLSEYRMDYEAVLLRLKPHILKAKEQLELTGETAHEVIALEYNNKHYGCSV